MILRTALTPFVSAVAEPSGGRKLQSGWSHAPPAALGLPCQAIQPTRTCSRYGSRGANRVAGMSRPPTVSPAPFPRTCRPLQPAESPAEARTDRRRERLFISGSRSMPAVCSLSQSRLVVKAKPRPGSNAAPFRLEWPLLGGQTSATSKEQAPGSHPGRLLSPINAGEIL
jgi:hypothetical protein